MKHVKKQVGTIVDYNKATLQASIQQSFVSNHYTAAQAQQHTATVITAVERWMEPKTIITTTDLRAVAAKHIATIDPAVSSSYKKHKQLW